MASPPKPRFASLRNSSTEVKAKLQAALFYARENRKKKLSSGPGIFGYLLPTSQPSSYGENLLTAAQATLDSSSQFSVQSNDAAFTVAGGALTVSGAQIAARWGRQAASLVPDGTPVIDQIYGMIAAVTALSAGNATPTGNAGGMSGSARTTPANMQAVGRSTGILNYTAGLTFSAGAVATVTDMQLMRIETLLRRPLALFLVVSQSNWVGNSGGYTRALHPHVPGALYIPASINRSIGADDDAADLMLPMMAMEPMQHQTLNQGGGPGAEFCREVRKYIPEGQTVLYSATGYNGAGFKTGDLWNRNTANPIAYNGFWSTSRALWTRAQAWNAASYIAGVIVCVGESDLGTGNTAEHMTQMDLLLTDIRSEPGWGAMPIIFTEIGMLPGAQAGLNDANVARLKDEQRKFATRSGNVLARSRCVYIDRPTGSTYNADEVHYLQATNIVRGAVAARAWRNIVFPKSTPLALANTVP